MVWGKIKIKILPWTLHEVEDNFIFKLLIKNLTLQFEGFFVAFFGKWSLTKKKAPQEELFSFLLFNNFGLLTFALQRIQNAFSQAQALGRYFQQFICLNV